MKKRTRPEILSGPTYKLKVPNHRQEMVTLYITLNHDELNRPFEIFIRCDDHVLHEHFTAFAILVSGLLRLDVHLNDIAEQLLSVPSPLTGHYIPGTSTQCASIYARIGHTFMEHTSEMHTYNPQQASLAFEDN